MKVHELAKKIGIPSKELLKELKKLKIDVTSHMSKIDNELAEIVEQELSGEKPAPGPTHVRRACSDSWRRRIEKEHRDTDRRCRERP